ncbi:hypothetical protein D3C79_999930 [compost metagenome]
MRFSSAATARVTLAADMPKRRAAAEKPWSWATAAKTCISWKRSMGVSSIQIKKIATKWLRFSRLDQLWITYSTVTDFARLRGWSTSVPFSTAT